MSPNTNRRIPSGGVKVPVIGQAGRTRVGGKVSKESMLEEPSLVSYYEGEDEKTELEHPTSTFTKPVLTHKIACTKKIIGNIVSPIMCVNQSSENTEEMLKESRLGERSPVKDKISRSKDIGAATEWEISGREDMSRADSESFSFATPSGYDADSQSQTQRASERETERREGSGGGGDGESGRSR